ncbi:hypothetical protein [Kineococcus sp. R86509]|uniref:hypothetical protein n=1 Tax=Kineococcus sp. R86509 TaxID=3093851 RepID=UPI0036D302EB
MTNPLAVTTTAFILSLAAGVIAVAFVNRPTTTPASGNLLLLLRVSCFTIVPVTTFILLITGYSVLVGTLTPLSAVQSLTDLLNANSNFLHGLTTPTGTPTAITPTIAPEGTPAGPPGQ